MLNAKILRRLFVWAQKGFLPWEYFEFSQSRFSSREYPLVTNCSNMTCLAWEGLKFTNSSLILAMWPHFEVRKSLDPCWPQLLTTYFREIYWFITKEGFQKYQYFKNMFYFKIHFNAKKKKIYQKNNKANLKIIIYIIYKH